MAEIRLHSYISSVETFRLESTNAYLVDDLTQRACELNGIIPVYRYLMALYDVDEKEFLSSHQTIGGDGKKHNLKLRVRFHPVSTALLVDDNILDYYYNQLVDFLFNEFKLKGPNPELISFLLGLTATDYVKQMVERNETPSNEKSSEFLTFITFPANWNFKWLKKQVVRKYFIRSVQLCYDNCKRDLRFIKTAFIDGLWEVVPESRQELFKARVGLNEVLYDVELIVGHLYYNTPEAKEGPCLRIFQKAMVGDAFPITQMSYLNVINENTLEVNVRDEHPITLILEKNKLIELVTLIDGYYRMTGRFTAFLCSYFQPPSIVAMKKMKIHGPIRASFARNKLLDIKSHQGCYLVRQDPLLYRVYHSDIVSTEGRVISSRILETNEGHFRLDGDSEDNVFKKLSDLVSARLTSGKQLYQLAPCDYEKTGLQLCKEISEEELRGENDVNGTILNAKAIKMIGPYWRTSEQQWVVKGTYRGREVVYRVLKDDNLLKSFLMKANEALSWKCREIVPILGLGVSPETCLASEFMPMGSLHTYLQSDAQTLTIGDLGDAALCLAKAVWYLEENGFVHGRIRCKSAFVVDRSENSFKVKLGEPGLQVYDEMDVPWIAPEYLSVMDSVAHAHKADLYALGTTMWEIFNKAMDPFDTPLLRERSWDETRAFFACNGRLPLAAVPQEFCAIISDCWSSDPDKRRAPDAIVRDMHQLLYQIYKPGKYNQYARVDFTKVQPAKTPGNKPDSSPPPLPPLRRATPNTSTKPGRRNSPSSPVGLRKRLAWNYNNLLRFVLGKKKDYDSLSTVSDIEPTKQTAQPGIFGEDIFGTDDDTMGKDDEEDLSDDSDDSKWLIERKNLKMGDPVGQGFFGMVFKATLTRPSGEVETVAAKRVKSTVADISHKDLEREIKIMKRLRHPNIVGIVGWVEEDEVFLVMEFVGMGALPAYLKANRERLTHRELIRFSLDIVSAMAYLERRKVIHRDLALRNILVKSESCVKLSDFGLAQLLAVKDYYTVQSQNRNLPIQWYAPESILYNKFSMKSDVWSFGVTLWEMFTFGEDPVVKNTDQADLIGQELMAGYRLPCPENCPPDVYQMMGQCWRSDHNLRPSFATLLNTIRNLIESTG